MAGIHAITWPGGIAAACGGHERAGAISNNDPPLVRGFTCTYDDLNGGYARLGSDAYHVEYEYDAGGNRTRKVVLDPADGVTVLAETQYHYDVTDEMVDCDNNPCTPPRSSPKVTVNMAV